MTRHAYRSFVLHALRKCEEDRILEQHLADQIVLSDLIMRLAAAAEVHLE